MFIESGAEVSDPVNRPATWSWDGQQRIAMILTRMHATVTLLTVTTPWYGAKARETEENTGLPYGEVKDSI